MILLSQLAKLTEIVAKELRHLIHSTSTTYGASFMLNFIPSFLDKDGHRKLAEAVKDQIGSESEDFVAARQRVEEELQRISSTISDLVDR